MGGPEVVILAVWLGFWGAIIGGFIWLLVKWQRRVDARNAAERLAKEQTSR